MAKTDNTELAMQDDQQTAMVTMEDVMSADGNFINTLNLDSFEGKIGTLNAINAAASLKDCGDSVIDVCDCITMPGVRNGRNGAPDTQCQNTYLIDVDGHAWFTQSDGIARSVSMIAMLFPDFGKSTPDGCLHIRVIENKLANGNTIKSLDVIA